MFREVAAADVKHEKAGDHRIAYGRSEEGEVREVFVKEGEGRDERSVVLESRLYER